MLHIKLVGMQRDTNFAPNSGIPLSKGKYLATGGQSFNTEIQGVCKMGVVKHLFKGSYDIEKLNSQTVQNIKRDLIAFKGLHAGKVKLIVSDNDRELFNGLIPITNLESTNKRIKNTILKLTHYNKIFQL